MVGQIFNFHIYKHTHHRLLPLKICFDNYVALWKHPLFIIHTKRTLKQTYLKNTSHFLITQRNKIKTFSFVIAIIMFLFLFHVLFKYSSN